MYILRLALKSRSNTHQFVKHSQEYLLLEIQLPSEISKNTNIATHINYVISKNDTGI